MLFSEIPVGFEGNIFGRIYEYFLGKFAMAGGQRGIETIAPKEVKAALRTYPRIEDVAVIGVPDEEWGEQPRAIVVLKPGEKATVDEIIKYCRARMSSFKRPRSVIFVNELPRNPMGKVLKWVLRKQYRKV